jgi:DNA gyrase subunit B
MANEEKLETEKDGSKGDYDASQLIKLEFPEYVRIRPRMYIGTLDQSGLFQLFKEVIADSMGEVVMGHCDHIKVALGKDYSITVEDNGRAIPVEISTQTGSPIVELKMTTFSTPWKQSQRGYTPFAGLHSIGGVCTVNALSEWMETTVKVDGKMYHIRFERGVVTEPLHAIGECPKDETGTAQKWLVDKTIFKEDALDAAGNLNYNPESFLDRIQELCFLNKNITIIWHDELHSKQPVSFHYKNGLNDYIAFLNKNKQVLHKYLFYCEGKDDIYSPFDDAKKMLISAEIAFQYNLGYEENIHCFANNIPQPEGGTHLSGFKSALTQTLNQYAKENNLSDGVIEGVKFRKGITAIVSVRLETPQFNSQDKVKLTTPEVEGLISSVVGKAVGAFLEENPEVARAIIKRALSA